MAKMSISSFLTGRGTDLKASRGFGFNILQIAEYDGVEYPPLEP